MASNILLGAVALQVGLGVATLVLVVPLPLALLHQLGAVAVFSSAPQIISSSTPSFGAPVSSTLMR